MTEFDRRLTPARADLAARALEGRVAAPAYVDPKRRRVTAFVVDLRAAPRFDLAAETQAVRGEAVDVLDVDAEGWAWVQLVRDGYVGYLPAEALGPSEPAPTHVVAAVRSLAYSGPDIKTPVAGQLVQNALVTVTGTFEKRNLVYAELSDGTFAVFRHLRPVDAAPEPDFVAVAEDYVGVPYLWGGRTSLGTDCSGLVQSAFARAGRAVPRDADMQEAAVGRLLDWDGDARALRRGDLVFWKGHVAIVTGENHVLHANGFHMSTVIEPLDGCIARIAAGGIPVTSVRRPD